MPLQHFGVERSIQSPASHLPAIPTIRLEGDDIDDDDGDLEEGDGDELDELEDDDDSKVVITPALIRITAVSGLGSLMFGYDTGCISGALIVINKDLGGVRLTTSQESWIVSAALVGALFGSLAAGRLADWLGRKIVLLVAAAFLLLGSIEQAAAMVYKEMVLGRVIVGVGVGLASAVIPLYLAEMSPSKYRGRIVASLVVLVTGGQVLAYLIDMIFYPFPSGWRYMIGLGAVPAIAQLVLSFALPESPRHLISNERLAPARKILRTIYPRESEREIQRRVERIVRDLERERTLLGAGKGAAAAAASRIGGGEGTGRERWKLDFREMREKTNELVSKLWSDRANRKALGLACGLQMFQQATGFNCLMYYSGKILQAAHFSKPVTFAMLIAISNFLCTIIALRLIDHTGRRLLLLRTVPGMVVGMFFTGLAFIFIPSVRTGEEGAGAGAGAWAYVALVSVVVFCCSYALGLGNVPWVVQSEVFFRHELRAVGTSLATATNWLANLIVAATFLHISEGLTPTGAFWLYSFISILAWAFTYAYLPETKGLDLESIRILFEGESAGYDVVGGEAPLAMAV
ncbi:general substrate transporter [Meredithblackwellia eburnea MCA 4105]